MNIYQEHILDHYSNPRNKGQIDNPDIYYKDTNPLCGDEVAVYARLDRSKSISEIRFMARGCAISQASASMLTEHVKGKSLDEVYGISSEDMLRLLMVPISHVRMKCALLALKTLQAGILVHMKGKK
ncbi:iron-sulfur cluster assembly scaffold protein [Candidatus Woesearchaeota archaeon]|nr:iron-sulfur cluster assembly scaffold protein [Candidatus Woesearchaeota archaeon]